MNGTRGQIQATSERSIKVLFPAMKEIVTLQEHRFGVICPDEGRDIAARYQIRMRLAFASTVHRAQGVTITRVEIDCRNMRIPGQLAVAISHVRNKKGLRDFNLLPTWFLTPNAWKHS